MELVDRRWHKTCHIEWLSSGRVIAPLIAVISMRKLISPLVTVTLVLAGSLASAQGHSDKVDPGGKGGLRTGAAPRHVITTVEPGKGDGIRQALETHGDIIKSDAPIVDAF